MAAVECPAQGTPHGAGLGGSLGSAAHMQAQFTSRLTSSWIPENKSTGKGEPSTWSKALSMEGKAPHSNAPNATAGRR